MHRTKSASSEIEVLGTKSTQWAVHGDECPLLKSYKITSLGYTKATRGYSVSRLNPPLSNLNVTISGSGMALINEKWKTINKGTTILSPQGKHHAAKVLNRDTWEFCWVCFSDPALGLSVSAPTSIQSDSDPLAWAILSFGQEFRTEAQASMLQSLLQTIDLNIKRVAAPWNVKNKLWRLWKAIEEAPKENWTAQSLSRLAHISERQLLRHCRQELGRSLHEQITHIRMNHASSLLQFKDMKLQGIAEAVGYNDAFSFSKAFKAWSGVSPSDYRNLHS